MNALRKALVFLPQMFVGALSTTAWTIMSALGPNHPAVGTAIVIVGVVTSVIATVTTFIKSANIADNGWGQYIPDRPAKCVDCAKLRASLSAIKKDRDELHAALAVLDPDSGKGG